MDVTIDLITIFPLNEDGLCVVEGKYTKDY